MSSRSTLHHNSESDHFESLVRRYYVPINRFFRFRGIDPEECEDLTQDTFLSAYRSLDGLRQDTAEGSWLFAIARNIYLNAIRRQLASKRSAREVRLDEPGGEGSISRYENMGEESPPRASEQALQTEDSGALKGLLAEERYKLLETAITKLPPRMRSCLLLRISQGLKYREIAEVMQISINTIKSQLSQGKERLGNELGARFSDTEP